MPERRSDPHNLDDVLDVVCDVQAEKGEVSVGDLLAAVGERSFGPFLVILSLVAFTPLGGIPGVPTVLATMVILLVGQLVLGVRHFWLPRFVLKRSIKSDRLRTTVRYLRPPARWIDKVIRPRLSWMLKGKTLRGAALGCVLVALTVPPLELVPFAGTVSWAAMGAFGLAVIGRDGVLALIALAIAIGGGFAVGWMLL